MNYYTLVLKQKTEEFIIFDVFKKPLFGRQRVVGNVFCLKNDNGEYKANTSIYMASWPKNIKWDGGRKSFHLEQDALWICTHMLEKEPYENIKPYEESN